jgi:hypothetical protein
MAVSVSVVESLTRSFGNVTGTYAVEQSASIELDVTLPTLANGGDSHDISFTPIDISEIDFLFVSADVDCSVTFYNGATPGTTLNLLANQPFVWQLAGYPTVISLSPYIAADVTRINVGHASTSTQNFKLLALVDSTP